MRYLVERDKLFLDPHLSLNRLSTITGTNTLYLSRAINVCTGHNFKTMLNDYRIEFAEALLKNNAAPRFSFKEFHTQCGFLSKSAFYSAFKKRMNMTPKEYLGWCMENADFSGGGGNWTSSQEESNSPNQSPSSEAGNQSISAQN